MFIKLFWSVGSQQAKNYIAKSNIKKVNYIQVDDNPLKISQVIYKLFSHFILQDTSELCN